jgi:hypothetical protein
METLDGIFIFASGTALGIMLGHWLGKKDCNLEYRRGYLDAQWAMFLKVVHDQLTIDIKNARNSSDGGAGNSEKIVH